MGRKASNRIFTLIFWGLFYLFIFALLLRNSYSYIDPDLGWHLKVGESIDQSGTVPHWNTYNFSYQGSWVDHEWLSDWLVYVVYAHQGYFALAVVFALLVVLALAILHLWARRAVPGAPPFMMAGLLLLGTVASLPHFGIRIQELGLLFLALWLLVVERYSREADWRWLSPLPGLMFLWSCLHASFLLGFALAIGWLAVRSAQLLMRRYRQREWLESSDSLSGRSIIVFLGFNLAAFGATLLTPYRAGLYSFLQSYHDSFYMGHIGEWLPQSRFPFLYQQILFLGLAALALGIYVYYSRRKERPWRLDLWTVALVGLFLYLGFKSRRHVPLLFVASFVLMVRAYAEAFRWPEGGRTSELAPVIKGYILFCLALAGLQQVVLTNYYSDPFSAPRYGYPREAVNFLKGSRELDGRRLFNEYAWGGYLIWNLPERKIFVDGRLPQLVLSDRTFLQEYLEFFRSPARAEEMLAKHEIELVLLPATDARVEYRSWEKHLFLLEEQAVNPPNRLRQYLAAADDWREIYRDEDAVIYSRSK